MNLLTPLAGVILAAAVIPPLILLYFLKLRRKPQAIASTLLWQRSVEDLRANAPFQRLRKSLLLLLQLLALGLLAASVMQPQIQGGRLAGGKTVIIIDNSASMGATDVKASTRLEEAKDLARSRVEELHGGGVLQGSGGETMIVAFSDRAEIYCQFTDIKAKLLRAIDKIEPTDGATVIEEALKLARAHTTNVVDSMGEARPIGDPATIELYSDGRIQDLADQVTRGETVRFHPIGTTDADNVSIASISVERPFDAPTKVQIFVALLNYNPASVTCRLELSVNGDVILGGLEDVEVPAGSVNESTQAFEPGRRNLVFQPFEQPRDAIIVVRNLRQDTLESDNIAQIVVPPARRLRVALVNRQSFILETALEGLPLETLTDLTEEQFLALAEADDLDRYDVFVFDGRTPDILPPSRYLIFGAAPTAIEGLNPYGEPGGRQFILDVREDHPAMRFVAMDRLYVSRHVRIQPGDDVKVLARGSETPLIVEMSKPPMRLVYVAFDPLDSNWPLERSFVTFMFNAVEYLGTVGEAISSESLAPGDAITTRLPGGATNIQLRSPDATNRQLDVSDPTMFSWGPLRRTGVYTLSWDEGEQRASRSFAANLLSVEEGHLARADTLEMTTEMVEAAAVEGSRYTPLWPWALAICLGVIVVEWWVYNKKMFV